MPSPHALTVGCEAAFLDFAEPEADLNYESRVDGPDPAGRVPVRIGLRQFGQYVVEGRVELLPDPTTKRTETQHGE